MLRMLQKLCQGSRGLGLQVKCSREGRGCLLLQAAEGLLLSASVFLVLKLKSCLCMLPEVPLVQSYEIPLCYTPVLELPKMTWYVRLRHFRF